MNTRNTYYKNCDIYNANTIIDLLISEGFIWCKIIGVNGFPIERLKELKGIKSDLIKFVKVVFHKDNTVTFITNHNYKFKFY